MRESSSSYAVQKDKTIQAPVGGSACIAFGSVQLDEKGVFVGYEDEKYIIVRLPTGFDDFDLKLGQSLRLNYNFAGNAYSYETSVLHYLKKYELVFLSHPQSFESNPLRKEDRVSCRIPATASFKDKAFRGLVTDISHHGCQFCVKIPATFTLHQISLSTQISLSLFLSETADPKTVKGKIRNTNFDECKIELGIEFEMLDEPFSQRLDAFIEKLSIL